MAVQQPKAKPKPKPDEDEFLRLTKWRFNILIEMGLSPDAAISLIEIPDVTHAAQALVDAGCPIEFLAGFLERD